MSGNANINVDQITNARTVDSEEKRHEEAQAWIENAINQKESLANVVDIFKQYVKDAPLLKQYVLSAQEDLVACQQKLVACRQELAECKNSSGKKQGGRKSRRKSRRKRKSHKR